MQALEEAHDRYVSLYEFAPVGYVTVNADGTISEVNRAGEPLFGVDRTLLRGNKFAAYVDPEDGDRWHVAFTGLEGEGTPGRRAPAPSARRHEMLRLARAGAVEVGTRADGPDRARRPHRIPATGGGTPRHAGQIAAATRLASMETLVAGVAHEDHQSARFQPRGPGDGRGDRPERTDHLRGSEPLDREAEAERLDAAIEELNEALEASRRIERIVQHLKLYGQNDAPKQLERLADIVDQAVRWVPGAVRSAATVRVENAGAPDVKASSGQIVQVVVNLLVNAAKAARPGRPSLVIARIGPGGPGMARLEVIDDGAGLDPQALSRVFDPVFTTGD